MLLSVLYADDPGETIIERATQADQPFMTAHTYKARPVSGRGLRLAEREAHALYSLPVIAVPAPLAQVVNRGLPAAPPGHCLHLRGRRPVPARRRVVHLALDIFDSPTASRYRMRAMCAIIILIMCAPSGMCEVSCDK